MFEIGDRVNVIEFDKEAIVVGINEGCITVEYFNGVEIDVFEDDLEFLGSF